MRPSLLLTCAALTVLPALSSQAQGLVAVQNYSGDFLEDSPLTWSLSTRGGYDVLDYSAPVLDGYESYYIQGGVGATFTEADPTTPFSVAVDLGAIHYFDSIPRFDDTFYNARLAFNISHQISQRLKISNNFYLAYEAQPNIASTGSTTLFNGQYLYGYNNFNVSYAWSQRFSTTTSYTVDGITYEDDIVSGLEDRLSHLIAQQFSYAMTKRTSLVAEYRYKMVRYRDRTDINSFSHFALAGVDHAWSQRFTGSFRAGAEIFKTSRTKNTAPYGEVALNYAVARQTQARWFGAVGFDGAEVGGFDSRYSARTGVNISHQINKRVGVNAGVAYAYSKFDGGAAGADVTENTVQISAGMNYQLTENLLLDAGYSYSVLSSDDALREFNRHNVFLGLTASF